MIVIYGNGNEVKINAKTSSWSDENRLEMIEDKIYFNGKVITYLPSDDKNMNVSVVNGRLYMNGYEWIDGKWVRNLRALWHLYF